MANHKCWNVTLSNFGQEINCAAAGRPKLGSALPPKITETILEAAGDGCTLALAFRYMVYNGNQMKTQSNYKHLYL